MKAIDRESDDIVDAVFALLDDITPSLFSSARPGTRFCDGATTQQIATHIGSLQREGTRLDREGRDYWIKPLRELGAIEPVYLQPETGAFILGHLVAKSPNSAYRLAGEFRDILAAPESEWKLHLKEWIQKDRVRSRLEFQAQMAELARKAVDTKHSDLILACQTVYTANFLPDYEVIYVNDGDGDRITQVQREILAQAGIEITLSDAIPDLLLWNQTTDALWVVEAVTSTRICHLEHISGLWKTLPNISWLLNRRILMEQRNQNEYNFPGADLREVALLSQRHALKRSGQAQINDPACARAGC